MTTYDHDDLGVSASRGITGFIVIIIMIIAIVHITQHLKLETHYVSVQNRLIYILLAPCIFSTCALMGLFYNTWFIAMAIELYKSVLIAVFVNYLFAFVAATPKNGQIVYDKDVLYENLRDVESVRHVMGFQLILGNIDISSIEKAKNFTRRIEIAIWQLVILLPLMQAAAIAVNYTTDLNYENINLTLKAVGAFLTLIAMYHFKLVSAAISKLEDIKSFMVEEKTLCIHLGMLVPTIQNLVIGIFASTGVIHDVDDYTKEEINNYVYYQLLAAEMIVLAFVQVLVFKIGDFKELHRNHHPQKEADETQELLGNKDD